LRSYDFCVEEEDLMVLLPTVPVIQGTLQTRLGVLPSFRPLKPNNPYRHIVAALNQGRRQIEQYPALRL